MELGTLVTTKEAQTFKLQDIQVGANRFCSVNLGQGLVQILETDLFEDEESENQECMQLN